MLYGHYITNKLSLLGISTWELVDKATKVTLIAGFHSHGGTPVLIGDFLTTSGGDRYGLRKKVLLFADNCALAWTGHLLAANSVVTSLQSALDGDALTLESVKAILTDPVTSRLGALQVSLIGWVVDDRGPHCFRWNSGYPHELFLGSPMYDGSGESFVQDVAGEAGLRDSSSPDATNPDRAVQGALFVATNLMRSEMLGPTTRPLGFGFAYEILWLVDGQRFAYVDNVLYFAITCELDEFGNFLRSEFSGSVYKYEAHGNFTAVYVYNPSARHQDRHVITPVGLHSKQEADDLLRRIAKPEYPFPFSSDHYCVFLRLKAPNYLSPPVVMTFGKGAAQPDQIIDASEPNALSLRVSPEMVEWMYKAIREDQKGGK